MRLSPKQLYAYLTIQTFVAPPAREWRGDDEGIGFGGKPLGSGSGQNDIGLEGKVGRKLFGGKAHSRSLGYARDDKVEGGQFCWDPSDGMDRNETVANPQTAVSPPSHV